MTNTIPELSDEQIQSMRFAIMSDVSKADRAKTRKYRQVALGAAMVIALGGVGTTVVQSMGNSDIPGASSTADSKAVDPDQLREEGAASDSDSEIEREALVDEATPSNSGAKEIAPEDAAREVVTTGSIGMTVDEPVDTAAKISTYVTGAGGRVDSRSENASSSDDGARVRLVVRIPQTKVEASVEVFRTYGTVKYVNIEDYDVTTEGKDLDARIKALRISVDRLSALMDDADSTNELLRAETALTQRQAELDSLVSQRTGLTDRVTLSSIEIDLAAKAAASSPSTSGFWGGVVDGWNALVSTFEAFVHAIGVALPWLAVLGVAGALIWLVTRRRRA